MKEFWKERNVFVTGAGGFIAAWLTKALVEKEANVTILIRDIKREKGYGLLGLKEKVNIVIGDLVDYGLMLRVMNEYNIDSCFHLAAQAIVQKANASPLSTFESNIRGTWNIMEACRNSKGIERVVVASSDKAYGIQKNLPYTEESPLLGIYPYDASKACADIIARSYYSTYSLPVAVTRNANTYGGADLNMCRIVPDAICSLLKGREFVIRSDGSPERDYIYVKDVSAGYLMLAENLSSKKFGGEAFNFGSGKPIKVIDLFNKIAELCGKKGTKPKILAKAKHEIDRQYLGIEKARKVLGWKPKYSIREGLKETIDWYRNYLKANK